MNQQQTDAYLNNKHPDNPRAPTQDETMKTHRKADNQDPLQFVRLQLHGKVKGVNLRQLAKQQAMELDLHGQVQNDEQNQRLVHLLLEGSSTSLDRFMARLEALRAIPTHPGPHRTLVYSPRLERLEVTERYPIKEDQKQFSRFTVRYPDGIDVGINILLDKLSLGILFYQNFHRDSNENFARLEKKTDALLDAMDSTQQDLSTTQQD